MNVLEDAVLLEALFIMLLQEIEIVPNII